MIDNKELQVEIERLQQENSGYRVRLAEFERCDTTPPEPPTSRNGYALLCEQLRQLDGRVDAIARDASTAARMATEVRRNLHEAVHLELSGFLANFPAIVRTEVERTIKPVVERVGTVEGKIVHLEVWRRDFSERHCGECALGGSDEVA